VTEKRKWKTWHRNVGLRYAFFQPCLGLSSVKQFVKVLYEFIFVVRNANSRQWS